MSRRVVVTGAAGFAGTWLCRHLRARGDEVVGWVHHPVRDPVPGVRYRMQDLVRGDEVVRALAAEAPEEVYHLGAISHVGDCSADPNRAVATNVGGTESLLAGLPSGARMLLASSCHVYGRPQYLPVDEDHPLSPDSVYGRTKERAERLGVAAARGGRHVVIARAFHHTGPGQSPRYALADWARQIAAGEADRTTAGTPSVVWTGDLSLRRDYTDVRDVVAGYCLVLARAAPGDTVQLCSGVAPTLRALLTRLAGGTLLVAQRRPGRLRLDDIPELRGSPARAEALGWLRQYDVDRTLYDLRVQVAAEHERSLNPGARP